MPLFDLGESSQKLKREVTLFKIFNFCGDGNRTGVLCMSIEHSSCWAGSPAPRQLLKDASLLTVSLKEGFEGLLKTGDLGDMFKLLLVRERCLSQSR